MKTLEERIQTLEDIEAIKVLKSRYCAYCDSAYNAKGIASLFVDDGIWDGGFMGRFEGAQAIRAHFESVSSVMGFAIHHLTNPIIEISPEDNNRASGSWYLWQPCTQTTRSNRALWLAANYKDTYTKTNHGWQFVNMIITPKMFSPYESGWAEVPFIGEQPS